VRASIQFLNAGGQRQRWMLTICGRCIVQARWRAARWS
jgi:hypothetical protein